MIMRKNNLQNKRKANWPDIFLNWQKREGSRPEWQAVAKQKGWDTWTEWRSNWVKLFGAEDREWNQFTISNPLKSVPEFRVGPSGSWQKHFPESERNKHTFADLVNKESFAQNEKVYAILNNFPKTTEFIGLLLPDNSIVIIDGHHRAAALALAAKEKKNIVFDQSPVIFLAKLGREEVGLLDVMLKRGSTKEPPA